MRCWDTSPGLELVSLRTQRHKLERRKIAQLRRIARKARLRGDRRTYWLLHLYIRLRRIRHSMAHEGLYGTPGYRSTKVTKRRRQAVLERDGHRCTSCGRQDQQLTMHHLVPASEGGHGYPDNLTTLCQFCHARTERERRYQRRRIALTAPNHHTA